MTQTSALSVPRQYRTGKTLGRGTYAVVKEAIHVETGKFYACKVIDKRFMQGKEYMVRNEIAVLQRVSTNHRNIVNLLYHFETASHVYMYLDLCSGGELLDRVLEYGSYREADAADLVRTILKAVQFIHDRSVVHGDIKPENLMFRTAAADADIAIIDFGLSRVVEEDKPHEFKEICGTTGYMAPEIYKKTGHSMPVDIWAMGVVTYFLLSGYTPFSRDNEPEVIQATLTGEYEFEPKHYWKDVSEGARDFIKECLTVDSDTRPTAGDLLRHEWMRTA